MKVVTNHKQRELLSYWDLTPKELLQFDYIENMEEEGVSRFFRYLGSVYDTGEFMRLEKGGELESDGWRGFCTETYFSGVLIRYSRDCEAVVVGRYYC